MARLRTNFPRIPLAGAIRHVANTMAALALVLSTGCVMAADAQLNEMNDENGHVMSRQYPGLQIQGHNDDDSRSLEIEKVINKMIEKCRTDSFAFRLLLSDLAAKLPIGKTVTMKVWQETKAFLVGGDQLGIFFLDLEDLSMFPDPIPILDPDGRSNFQQNPPVPNWATTRCAVLGHELIEHMYELIDGKVDRSKHHYLIANPLEDQIVRDYFGAGRSRSEDCQIRDGDHHDIMIKIFLFAEIDHAIEVLHVSDLGGRPADLLSITYVTDRKFPGRNSDSVDCKTDPS